MDEFTKCPEGCTATIEGGGSVYGFTGALIYWVDYSCGHQDVDDSSDNLSAVE